MSITTNDARFDLQFIDPAKYQALRHNWEKDILAMFARSTQAAVLSSSASKEPPLVQEPVATKCELVRETVPIHLKAALTIREAAAFSNIGINKIDSLLRAPNCPFVLYVGTKKLVKRREFEQFISNKLMI